VTTGAEQMSAPVAALLRARRHAAVDAQPATQSSVEETDRVCGLLDA
jgi:hypothetical protein